tara:strand:- start:99 stop:434 length:336 start_codon:yes stop_codon:yes gene_type:complete
MSENVASFYLMVVVAMSDHELHDREAIEIKEIANKYKIDFDPYEAAFEIKSHYKNDFNKACDYYMSVIQNTDLQKDTIEFIKNVIYSDKKIRDSEMEILEKCRKKWGYEEV